MLLLSILLIFMYFMMFFTILVYRQYCYHIKIHLFVIYVIVCSNLYLCAGVKFEENKRIPQSIQKQIENMM